MRIHQELRDSPAGPPHGQPMLEAHLRAARYGGQAPAGSGTPTRQPAIEVVPAADPAGSDPALQAPTAPPPAVSQTVIDPVPAAAKAPSRTPVDEPRAQPSPESPALAAALSARVDSLERAVEDVTHRDIPPPSRWPRWYMAAGLAVIVGAVALFSLWLQRRVDDRLNDAALRVSAAERQRDAAIDATREDAARQVADARQSAAQAQIVGNVLAAPDLVRYWLRGATPDSPAYGHVLFSRTRGLVFSASRLAPADAGRTYQLWLSTRTGPISAGLVNPDTEGRVTLASEVPLTVTGRLAGAFVTVEPEGGRTEPSSQVVLVRIE
jgi:Anti-sigma-K factor rskA